MTSYKITKNNFEQEVLQSKKTVLLDFFATWCMPCKMLAPVLDDIAEEYADRVKLCKVNIDEEEELAAAFQVTSIPTVVVMKNGRVIDVSVGYKKKEDIVATLQRES